MTRLRLLVLFAGLGLATVGAGRWAKVVVLVVVDGASVVSVVSVVSGVVVGVSVGSALASERRMAGSWLRWGTPAMATPTAALTSSMMAVSPRWPGLTGTLP